jgi:hypothetical protein
MAEKDEIEIVKSRVSDFENSKNPKPLSLPSAEEARSEYFITCDDKIIKNYRGGLKALNPVQFILEEGGNTNGTN